MILPRRLMTLADGTFCEEHDPKQAMNFRPKGFVIPDGEAERIGLKAYLDATGWGDVADVKDAPEAKAVVQAETEDKAVKAPQGPAEHAERPPIEAPPPPADGTSDEAPQEPQEPGLHLDTSARRLGRRT